MIRKLAFVVILVCILMVINIPAADAQQDDPVEITVTHDTLPAGWKEITDTYSNNWTLLYLEKNLPSSGEFPGAMGGELSDGMSIEVMRGRRLCGWSCPAGGREMADHFETVTSDTPFSYMDRVIDTEINFLGYPGYRVTEDGNNYCARIHIYPQSVSRLSYWLDIGGGEWVFIQASAGSLKQCDQRFPPDDYVRAYVREIEGILSGLRFTVNRKPSTTVDLPENSPETGTPWVTVIGTIAAGGAAVTAAAAGVALEARNRKKAKDRKDKKEKKREEDDEAAGYILQVSQDQITLSENQPAGLQAVVWEVDLQGRTKRAQNAMLEIEAPVNAAYLTISPRQAQGTLDASLSLTNKPTAPGLQLTVRGSVSGTSSSAQITLEFADETKIEIETDDNRRSLRADGKDGLYVYARVAVEEETDPEALKAAQDSLEFKIEGAGKDWVDASPTQEMDDWKAVYLRASNPDALRPNIPPPAAVDVKVNAEYKGQKYTNKVVINLLGAPVLKISENYAAFLLGQSETTELKVWIEPPDDQPWVFDYMLMEKSSLVGVHFQDEEELESPAYPGAQKKLVITESGGFAEEKTTAPNGLYASDTLRVFAELDDLKIHNDVDVCIFQEGLFIDPIGRSPDGAYHLKADGKKTPKIIDFRLLVWDTETRQLTAEKEKSLELSFALLDENEKTIHMMEVAQLQTRSAGMRPSNLPSEMYRFWIEKELPSDGEVLKVLMQAYSDLETVNFRLGVESLAMPHYLPRDELARCQHILDKHVPPESKAKLQEILDKKSITIGPEGLFEFRKQLWNTTQMIIQGEGGQGYHAEAVWANRIVGTLEWAKWAGDHCFTFLVFKYLGPTGSLYAPFVKELLIDFLSACINEGKTPAEWLQGYLDQIQDLLSDIPRLLDAMAKEGWEEGKKRGWQYLKQALENRNVEIRVGGVYRIVLPGWVVYKLIWAMSSFATYVYYGKKSIFEAARMTIWDVSDETIGDYLMELGMKKGDQNITKVFRDELSGKDSIATKNFNTAWKDIKAAAGESGRIDAPAHPKGSSESELDRIKRNFEAARKKIGADSEAAKKIKQGAKVVNGKLYADRDDVLELMRDPVKVRSLKDAPRDVQEAFENTRNKFYAEHDAKLTRWVKNNVPEAKNAKVIVDKFRTPGKGGHSLGTDNDYRVCVEYVTPDGKKMRIEIDQRKWDNESYRIFSEITGGPGDYKGSREWANGLQQLGTDRFNTEASPDFSDQATVFVNEKGWVVNPATYKGKVIQQKIQVKPNIISVKEGKALLKDPDYLGKMYNNKVGDALHKGSKGDAYVQASKGVETLNGVRKGYAAQGYKITPLSPEMEKGMRAVEIAAKNFNNPDALAWADSYLSENGLGGLTSFTEKMASQFDAFKLAVK